MNHIASNTPPFTPAPTPGDEIELWADRHPALFVSASIVIGLTAAAVIGTLIGMLVYAGFAADCHSDGWCELGAALLGLLAGCVAGGVAHIVAGVVFIRQHLPQGKRTVPIVLHLVVPFLIYAMLSVLSWL